MEDILAKIKEFIEKIVAFVKDLLAKFTGGDATDETEA